MLLSVVISPFGRVPQAMRESDLCAEPLGCRTVTYRTASTVAGALLVLWLGCTGPDTTLSFQIMRDILLITGCSAAWARCRA
jgi:branched-chain amino acid transport system permease protein